jgi:hypothetical protein
MLSGYMIAAPEAGPEKSGDAILLTTLPAGASLYHLRYQKT